MPFSRNLPLRHKLTLLVTLTSGLVLTLAALALVTYDLRSLKQHTEDDLRSLAQVLASNSTAALTFDDARTAGEILGGLVAKRDVTSARLYDAKGRPFATYQRAGDQVDSLPEHPRAESYQVEGGDVLLFQEVRLGDEVLGTLYVKAGLGRMRSRFQAYLVVLVLVMVGSLALASLVSSRWQRQITEPMLRLAAAAAAVAQNKDYSLRVTGLAGGELATLTDAFNEMLAGIQQRDHDLKKEMRERLSAQEALHASESKFRSIVETTNEWVWSSDLDDRSTYDNPAVERILGYAPSELLGRRFADLIHPDERGGNEEMRQDIVLRQQGFTNFVCRVRHKDGSYRTLESSGAPIFDGDGNMIGLQGSGRDITESRLLEEQLRQAQKMEAVGQLAGGVAHDFNNLLSVILGYTELVKRSGLPPATQRKVDEIWKAGDRAAALVRQLLAFSRKQVLAPKVLDLGSLVTDFAKMLPRVLREDVTLEIESAPELGQVKADPGQIEQILMNLAVNARDAMPEGGILRIRTGNATLDDGYVRTHVGSAPGSFVVLTVSDTGCGMDEKLLARAFEPFFTTKEQGKGTGLGLATVYGIVTQSDGHVAVESAPGKGTTFRIYLPRVDAPVTTEPAVAVLEPVRRGKETILLVEDEEAVRVLITDMLQELGHTVLAANCGRAALEASDRHAGPIHLLLSDVVMPGLSGRQTAERLSERRKETKVVYMSGHADDTLGPRGVLDADTVLLNKPFGERALNQCLRAVLG
jgi:PAS domain S-box-containing protein